MKRIAAAGAFAMFAGGVILVLLASVFYSCRGGGQPHDMGTSATESPPAHVSHSAPPQIVAPETRATDGVRPIGLGFSAHDDLYNGTSSPYGQ